MKILNNRVLAAILVAATIGGVPGLSSAETAADYYQEARGYFDKGEYRSAVIELKNALQAQPDHAPSRLLLGRIYLMRGDAAAAEKEFRKAREAGAARSDWVEPWGRSLLASGQAAKVLAQLEPQEEDSPELKAAIFELRARALAAESRFDEAAEALDRALKIQPDRASAMLVKARLALQAGRRDEAQSLVERAVQADPSLAEGWIFRAQLAQEAGDLKGAAKYFQEALRVEPENPLALAGLAQSQLLLGKTEKAAKTVAKLRERWPDGYLVNFLRGWVALAQNHLDEAEESLTRALNQAPDHAPSLFMLGLVHLQRGHFNQAIERLGAYVRKVPGDNNARRLLGAAFLKADKPDKAIEVLQAGIREGGADPRLLALLGNAYLRIGENTKGMHYLEQAAEQEDSPAIQTQLALGYMATGKTGEAVKRLESVVAEAEGPGYADLLLIMSLLKKKQFDEAEQAAVNLRKKLPDNPVPVNLLGVARLGKNDLEGAREAFEEALRLQPDFVVARVNLALLDQQQGDLEAARQQLDKALAAGRNDLNVLMARARLERQAGNQAAALNWFRKAHERNPDAVAPALVLIDHYLSAGEPFEALNVANAIYERQPKDPRVLEALARSQLAAGEASGATATLRKLDALMPDDPRVRYRLAQVYMKQDKLDLAEDALREALRRDPRHLPSLLLLGKIALDKGDAGNALAIARRIKKDMADQAAGDALEGAAQMAAGRYAEAVRAYRAALDKQPSSALLLDLYRAYEKAGRRQEGMTLLRDWLARYPDDASARLALADALMAAGNYKEAAQHYRQVVDKGVQNLVVLNNLAWALLELGDSECVRYGKQAYEMAAKRPEVLDTYGWCLVKSGEVDRGLTLLQEAAVRAPHMPTVRYHMAVALKEAGRGDEARKELQRLLKKNPRFPEADKARALLESVGD